MNLAFFTHLPWPEDTNPQRIIFEATEQVQYAEELGYKSAWLAEHHFTRYSIGSSSLIVATHLAAQTKTIRLGTGVLVSPLHNPIRLAGDTATLDLTSGGRLDVGFGRGTSGYEYHGYDIDPGESQLRFQESISIIQGLWTTPDFDFQGKFFRVNRANLVPPPIQQPHPPIYIAATRSPETLDFAVSSGHHLCVAVVQDTAPALDLLDRYAAKCRESGAEIALDRIPFFRYMYVAETEEQARNDTEARLNWVADIMQWRRFINEGSEVYQRMADWRATRTELPSSYEYLSENRAIIGTPDQCVAKIKQLQERGVRYLGCNFDFGGIEHEKVLKAMELFSKEVVPRLG